MRCWKIREIEISCHLVQGGAGLPPVLLSSSHSVWPCLHKLFIKHVLMTSVQYNTHILQSSPVQYFTNPTYTLSSTLCQYQYQDLPLSLLKLTRSVVYKVMIMCRVLVIIIIILSQYLPGSHPKSTGYN